MGGPRRTPMTEPWLNKRELARKLGISTRTVERLKLPCHRVGGQNRYVMTEVELALAGRQAFPDNVKPIRPRHREVAA